MNNNYSENERRRLDKMPFDHAFWLDDLHEELCHATGYEVFDEETGEWWNEYVDSCGNLHYGG